MRAQPHIRTSPAFTLMEMILALGISAVVLTSIGGVFFSALRLRERTVAALEDNAPVHEALAWLRVDLKNALPPGGVLARDFILGAVDSTRSESTGLQFATTTGTLKANQPWSDVQEVIYELRTPTVRTRRGGRDLVRTVSRNLLSTMAIDATETVLLPHVETLEFACYDGYEWRDYWDTTLSDTNLPTAVRVRVQLAPDPEFQTGRWEPLELVVPLVTLPPAAATQTEAQP